MRWVAVLAALVLSLAAAWAQEPAKGWLGIELKDMTKEEADALGWEGPRGANVVKPVAGGPAEKAGLLPGDILLSVDGVEVETMAGVVETVSGKAPGAEIKLRLLRGGKEKRLAATLGIQPAERLLLMLDTGGHMADIKALAWTPDGRQIGVGGKGQGDPGLGCSYGQDGAHHPRRGWGWRRGQDLGAGAVAGWELSGGRGLHGHLQRSERNRGGSSSCLRLGDRQAYAAVEGTYRCDRWLRSSCQMGSGSFRGAAIKPQSFGKLRPEKALQRLVGHTDAIYPVGFTTDGKRAVTGSLDHTLKLWNVETGKLISTMRGHSDYVMTLAISPRGNIIASGGDDGAIRLWDARTGRLQKVLIDIPLPVTALCFDRSGTRLLESRTTDLTLDTQTVWDIAARQRLVTYGEHKDNAVVAAAFSPDGRWVATGGGDDQAIYIWNASTGERRKGLDGQPLTLVGTGRPAWAVGVSEYGTAVDGRTRTTFRPAQSCRRHPRVPI